MDVGVRLPLHLFDRAQGRLQATRAELAAAEARARTIRSDQALRLQAAHRKLARAVAAATVLREAILPRAAQVLQGAEARYRAGDLSLTELVPLRRDWTRVRLDASGGPPRRDAGLGRVVAVSLRSDGADEPRMRRHNVSSGYGRWSSRGTMRSSGGERQLVWHRALTTARRRSIPLRYPD